MNSSDLEKQINSRKKLLLNKGTVHGNVVYWMSRDQRVDDNWALYEAQQQAIARKSFLIVVFCLQEEFLNAQNRQFSWMLEGLMEVQTKLEALNIPLYFLKGSPEDVIPNFVREKSVGLVITDFSPLKIKKKWYQKLFQKLETEVWEIDAHNVIPVEKLSEKEEFAAYTIRPKIYKLWEEYLIEIPKIQPHPINHDLKIPNYDFSSTNLKHGYKFKSGETGASVLFEDFLSNTIGDYGELRNDPNLEKTSNLSPYLHFGQISAQKVILKTVEKFQLSPEKLKSKTGHISASAFIEELWVRRELSENFCFYNKNYDNFQGIQDWAKTSLNLHLIDKRQFLYEINELENAQTHDDLWNACQKDMIISGKMPGYLRMYWAKKILEWSPTPQKAYENAIYLNDKYQLDGRDPNGYTGIAWSIGGVHDRPWPERPIFGKIRYMNYGGCERKFNVKSYIQKIQNLENQDDSLF